MPLNKFKRPFTIANMTNVDLVFTINITVLVKQSLNSEIVFRKCNAS